MIVYFPGHFLHLLNVQHPDFACHSLFLTGMVSPRSLQACSDFSRSLGQRGSLIRPALVVYVARKQ